MMHRLPDQCLTIVRSTILLGLLFAVAACGVATTTRIDPALTLESTGFQAPVSHAPDPDKPETMRDIEFMEVYDPWEPMNRSFYDFNAGFDSYVFLPATTVYETVFPSPVRKGVSNFVQNANEVPTFVNCFLQGKIEKGAVTFSRFFINSTFGVFGFMDLASNNKSLKLQKEDVGQTLGAWGVGNGPYFVMPILGPSNVRDTVGFGGDLLLVLMQMKYAYRILGVKNTRTVAITELLIRAINKRSNEPFRYHSTGSPYEYEMVRFIYTKRRELDIER